MDKIAVMIADDHPIVRNAIRKFFSDRPHIDILGEASNGFELMKLIEKSCPDIAVIDLEMPKMNGYATISELQSHYPQIKTIAFSGFLDSVNQQRVIMLGAFSTVSKGESVNILIKAVEMAIDGKHFHSKSCDFIPKLAEDENYSLLTSRERQILDFIAEGKTSKQISHILNISRWTVEKHRSNIKEKLGIKTFASLVRYAIEIKQN